MPAYPPLPWPQGFPPTTRDHVAVQVEAALEPERTAFLRFLSSPITGVQTANYLNAWLNVAWGALGKIEATYPRVYTERPTVDWGTLFVPAGLLMQFGPGSARVSMDRFFAAWRQEIDGFRTQWNVRHPAKEVLRSRLAGIGAHPIDEETRLEVQRLVTWAGGLARACQRSVLTQDRQMRDLIAAREFDLGGNLKLSAEWIGAAVGRVAAATLAAVWEMTKAAARGAAVAGGTYVALKIATR